MILPPRFLCSTRAGRRKAAKPVRPRPHARLILETLEDRTLPSLFCADLILNKTVSNPTPNVGDTIKYVVTVANAGPDVATHVVVSDLLPAGLNLAGDVASQGSYSPSTGNWAVGTLFPGAGPATLDIFAKVVSSAPQTNTATIAHSDEIDCNPIRSVSVTETPPPQEADLSLSKTVSNATPNVGALITYTITVKDNGPLNATNVIVQDVLPAGLTLVGTPTTSEGTYNATTGVWTVGTVANGASQTLTIHAQVVSCTPTTNVATITHEDQSDNTPADNTASVTETPQEADLSLTKTVSNPTPSVGDVVSFTITVTNNGPANATNVTVQDLLPAGLTLVGTPTTSEGTYNSTTGNWVVGTVVNGASETLSIQARVGSCTPATNVATITHEDQCDATSADNTASVTETPQEADLALTKTVSNPTPHVGDTVTFTVTVKDNGPADATHVVIKDLLPDGLRIVGTPRPSEGTYNGGTGIWTVGTVANGARQTLTIQALVQTSVPRTNTASVIHEDQCDDTPADDTASVTITPPPQADLSLIKTVSNPKPHVGDIITFTVTVKDHGPLNATNVVIKDLLPAGLVLVGTPTASEGTYNATTGIWTVGTVVDGGSETLTIQTQVICGCPVTNSATITHSDQFDPTTADNTAKVTETPLQADLSITKRISNPAPNVGDVITFTITVKDHGPLDATHVVVQDVLPVGLALVGTPTASEGTYNPTTGIWAVGTILNSGSETLTIQARVNSCSPVTNTAKIIHSDQPDESLGDNIARVTETPLQADLSITKTVNNPTPNFGSIITFTVTVRDHGPLSATDVIVEDALPAGLTITGTPVASEGTYNSTTGVWTVGTVPDGASETLTIQATVDCSFAVTNTATIIHSDQCDVTTADNTAKVTVTPRHVPASLLTASNIDALFAGESHLGGFVG